MGDIIFGAIGHAAASVVDILKADQLAVKISTVTLAPVILAIQYSIGSAGLLLRAGSFSDMRYSLRGLLNGLMTLFGLRKRRRYWGTVYDSLTKQPLDPAIVELIDAETGKVVEQSFTDLDGRFGFLDRPGRYTIRSQKTHYQFPSKLVTGTKDSIFDNVYHGETFEVRSDDNIIAPNIPMDQLAYDWNQEEKKRMGVGKFNVRLDVVITKLLQLLFWGGLLAVVLIFLASPTVPNGVFVLIYAFLAWLEKYLPKPHLWGRITSSHTNVNGLLIELRPASIPTVILGKALTNIEGKFFLKAPPGKYLLEVLSVGQDTNTSLHKRDVVIGKSMTVSDVIGV